MLRRAFLLVVALFWCGAAWATAVVDATECSVALPEKISHVLPAGPPAAILLAAMAPDLMLGWPSSLSDKAQRPATSLRVVCARGPVGLTLVAPGSDLAETFARAGWQIVAPDGQGPSLQATMADIRSLDPDAIIFTDPTMRTAVAESEPWRSLRAVRQGHAYVAPGLPFGWIDEPPSISRLLGLAWLGRSDPRTLATLFNAVVYSRVLTASESDVVVAGAQPMKP